ncbi:putative leucine-rich repeat receptor-like protein kinase At1g68400 [Wolffia australiana]
MQPGNNSLLSCNLLTICLLLLSSFVAMAELQRDYKALQAFKSAADPTGEALNSWARSTDPCSGNWVGVACRGGRVTRILLPSRNLSGSVNGSLTFLPYLRLLNLSHNHLSGELPESFLRLRRLRRVDLSSNSISGHIPPEISYLPRLLTLRLERNLFAGPIPSSIGSFSVLADFNVSGNKLSGEIPPAVSSFPFSSFSGNENLCGKPVQRLCSSSSLGNEPSVVPGDHRGINGWRWNMVATIAASAVAAVVISFIILGIVIICRRKRRKKDPTAAPQRESTKFKGGVTSEDKRVVLFDGCKPFTAHDLMRGSAEMLGRGTVGSTYRVVMEGETGRGVAVKRLRKVKKAVGARMEALERVLKEIGGLRHPNVVALRAYYHSDDELLLVYDYFPNGSLRSLLHGNRGPARTPLTWEARLKLALGAAQGLAFLHSASPSKLAHLKLSSSNILVDEQGNAHISDFALRHLLDSTRPAPERGSPAARTMTGYKSDVYRFGVILLEILTGRAAAEEEQELGQWVQMVVTNWSSDCFDVELLGCKEKEDEMVGLLQVALLCLAPSPGDRPSTRVVSKMIEEIAERGSKRGRIRGSCTPFSRSSMNEDSCYLGSSTPASDDTPTFASS